jgi:2-keto-4-pentenoate hydratase/2-oxohepta-3-ene-1,7-dioic acid hydratase in catechol pathway
MEIIRQEFGVAVKSPKGVIPVRSIIGIGRNYREHAAEQGAAVPDRPMVFYKSPASACLHADDIVVPRVCQEPDQTDYEAELAVIIGTAARNVPHAQALEHVLGYTCANDVSARWWQKTGSGGQFCRGKSFDSFCPLGAITPAADVPDPQKLRVRCHVSGETRQDASTGEHDLLCGRPRRRAQPRHHAAGPAR